VLAQEEAQRLGNNYIGTEHILLGIISEGGASRPKSSRRSGSTWQSAPRGRGDRRSRRPDRPAGDGLHPRAKRVIELAFEEARQLNHNYIGTEHLLLGLIREGEGVAAAS